MLKASELRKKYFKDDSNFTTDELEQQKQRIAKLIESTAKQLEESITIVVPNIFKKDIASWLEDNEYTVLGVNSNDNSLYIFWTKDLVDQMI